ncbi:MAG: exonuclease SbcCD subunit D [Chloroflexi bacterium]|nr:exonuclease SbcCD subunit D [Chloroflexota bacterium]
MAPIRVLHFADVHIGMENYGRTDPETGLSSRVRDFIRRMNEMIDFARENDVDLAIFAGDAFKTRNPNPTYQREFAWCVRDLTALAPLVMLVGNHDLPPTTLKASSIEIYDTLAVPNVWLADTYENKVIETKRGSVVVGAAPYPIRSRLLEEVETGGLTIAETDHMLQREMSAILNNLAADADQYEFPRVLTGHFTVNGARFGSERGIMLGRDIEVLPSDIADPRWDYVAMGHIHKHQNITEGREGLPPVVYSGSLERIDFGEEHDPKGFCWVELERGKAVWEFQRVKARPFVTIRADLRQADDPTGDLIMEIEERIDLDDAVVRVIVDLTPITEARFNEGLVRDALRQAHVNSIAAIRKEVEQPTRARLGGSPEGLTDPELLDRFLMAKGISEERRVELMQAADAIFEARNGKETAS